METLQQVLLPMDFWPLSPRPKHSREDAASTCTCEEASSTDKGFRSVRLRLNEEASSSSSYSRRRCEIPYVVDFGFHEWGIHELT
jgi:hypothetical protein